MSNLESTEIEESGPNSSSEPEFLDEDNLEGFKYIAGHITCVSFSEEERQAYIDYVSRIDKNPDLDFLAEFLPGDKFFKFLDVFAESLIKVGKREDTKVCRIYKDICVHKE